MVASPHLRSASLAFALIMTGAMSNQAQAESLLEKLEGNWKGIGTLQEAGGKSPLGCGLTAKYNAAAKRLSIKGRCGNKRGSRSFRTTFTQKANGTISGAPILQKSDVSNIFLAGRARATSVSLRGKKGKNALSTKLILTGSNTFQAQVSRKESGKQTYLVYVNWKRK